MPAKPQAANENPTTLIPRARTAQMARSSRPRLSRRDLLKLTAAGVAAYSSSGWIERVAAQAQVNPPARRKACILLWMNGGPSQMDTFDLKPGHANGGPFQETATS